MTQINKCVEVVSDAIEQSLIENPCADGWECEAQAAIKAHLEYLIEMDWGNDTYEYDIRFNDLISADTVSVHHEDIEHIAKQILGEMLTEGGQED